MFKKTEQAPSIAAAVRDEKIEALRTISPDDPKYKATLETVRTLDAVHTANAEEWRPTPDAVVKACAMVAAVVIVVAFEKSNVWTTKVTGFLPKFL